MLGRMTAQERLCTFILERLDHNSMLIDLPMSRLDIADYLGLTIETVSRMLTQLQADGLVEFPASRRFRILRRGVLARLAAG